MHGDLWKVWHKNYEVEIARSDFSLRAQSTNPVVACKAMRKLANYFGRGRKVKRKLTMSERMQSEVSDQLKFHCRFSFLWNHHRLTVPNVVFRIPFIYFFN